MILWTWLTIFHEAIELRVYGTGTDLNPWGRLLYIIDGGDSVIHPAFLGIVWVQSAKRDMGTGTSAKREQGLMGLMVSLGMFQSKIPPLGHSWKQSVNVSFKNCSRVENEATFDILKSAWELVAKTNGMFIHCFASSQPRYQAEF